MCQKYCRFHWRQCTLGFCHEGSHQCPCGHSFNGTGEFRNRRGTSDSPFLIDRGRQQHDSATGGNHTEDEGAAKGILSST